MKKIYLLLLVFLGLIGISAQGVFGGKIAVRDPSNTVTWFNTNGQTCDGAGTGDLSASNAPTYNAYLGDRFFLGANVLTFNFPSSNDGAFLQWKFYNVGGAAPSSWDATLTLPYNSSGTCGNYNNKKYEYQPNTGSSYKVQCNSIGNFRLDVNLVGYQNGENYTQFQSGNYIPITVSALENPSISSYSCSSTSNDKIVLNWSKWNSKDVIILRNTTGTFTDPTQGNTYNVNDVIGSSTVIYRGNATTFEDTVTPGQTYYYKYYSENWSYYSAGVLQGPLQTSSANLTSAAGTNNQTLLNDGSAITNIVYTLTNITDAVATNLPAGVTGVLSADKSTFTISGSPSTEGTYNYSIAYTATCGTVANSTGTIQVNSNVVEFLNIQYPKIGYTFLADYVLDYYAQVQLTGVTDSSTENSTGISVWIGYSKVNATSNLDFTTSDWTWIPAEYNSGYTSALSYYNANRDEYKVLDFIAKADATSNPLILGTEYYIVSRAQITGSSEYVYGGIDGTTSNTSGGIWDGTTFYASKLKLQDTITWDSTNKWKYYDDYNSTYTYDEDPVADGLQDIVPSAKLAAIIDADYDSSQPSFTSKKLSLNSGKNLTIGPDKYVTVVNEINIPSTATLTVKSDANLIQVNPAAANVGNITAERSVTDMNNITTQMDYVYWSAPVSGQLTKGTSGFSPGTPSNRFFSYRESNDRFYETGDTTFTPGKGYAVRAETGIDFLNGYSKTYKFTGEPNNGNISIPITKSPDNPVGTVHGYNLVGNPYPSNISFDQLYSENSGLIYNTAWFWTNASPEQYQLGSSYSGNNYAVLNGTGGNHATVPAGVSYNGGTPDGTIKVGQGFLVQATGSGNLNFANDMRISTSGTFFQKGTAVKNRFWLKLISPDNVINSQLIGYIPGATDGFEHNYDAEAFNLSSDLFYSIADGKNLLIQGKSDAFSTDDKIQLGANFFKNGNYTIALDHAEGIFNTSQPIYLKDIETGAVTDLSAKDYTFQATKGISEGRFQIVYKMPLSTGEVKKENVQIYRDGNSFIINAKQKMTDVEFYDASGRLILKLNPNAIETKIDVNHFLSGVFILKINLLSGEIVTKKIRK